MKSYSCRINIAFLLYGGVRYVICLTLTADASLALCHINNMHRLFSPSCCLLWLLEQPLHLNIKLFNQHVIWNNTGGSRLAYCKLSCWHMLIPKCLAAYTFFVCLSMSVSCQFPVIFYCFLCTVACKQLAEEAFKNREPECVFVMPSLRHIPDDARCLCMLWIEHSMYSVVLRLWCSVGIHPWWSAVHHRCTTVQPHRPCCYLSPEWKGQRRHLTDTKWGAGESFQHLG